MKVLQHSSLALSYVIIMMLLPSLTILIFGGPLGLSSIIKYLDEVVIVVMHFHVLYLIFQFRKKQKAWPLILYFLYWIWGIGLLLKNHLPASHLIQIAISGQFFIYFIFYYYLPHRAKVVFFKKLKVLLYFIFFSAIFFSIIQIIFPVYYHSFFPVRIESRGIFGISINSIFSSRVFFAEFLLIFMMLNAFLFFNEGKNNKVFILGVLFFSFIAMLYTGSRKELLFSIIIIFFYLTQGKLKKILLYIPILLPTLYVFAVIFMDKFAKINEVAVSDQYVRLHIFNFAVQIIKDYFPFGSGPGTFGSIMSVSYQDIYIKYGVGENILGFSGQERGPIFDMFLISFIAEIGLGIIFTFLFIIKVYYKGKADYYEKDTNKYLFFFLSSVLIVYLSFMTPILNNWVGFLLFSIMAVFLTDKRQNLL